MSPEAPTDLPGVRGVHGDTVSARPEAPRRVDGYLPLERYGVFANLRYEISPDINFSVRTLWNRRKSKNRAAPLPFGVGVGGCRTRW